MPTIIIHWQRFLLQFQKKIQHASVENYYFGYGNSSSGTRVHPRGQTDLSEVIGRMFIWFAYQLHNEHGVLQLDDGRWYAYFLQKWNVLQENGISYRIRSALLWRESSSRKWYVDWLTDWFDWLNGQLIDWMDSWLIEWTIDWLISSATLFYNKRFFF